MTSDKVVIEEVLNFTGNGGSFNEQPLWVLVKNKALTGDDFVSLMRLRTEKVSGLSGALCLKIGSTAGVVSFTGSNEVFSNSVSGNSDSPFYSATSVGNTYTITHVITDYSRHDVILKDGENLFGDIQATGQEVLGNLDVIGTGIRPDPDTLPTDGSDGNALVAYHTFNREELGSSLTSVADRSGNSLTAAIKGSGSGDGTSATVTGFSFSPCEGGFRFDGTTWLESATSTLYTLTGSSTAASGYTVMTFAKFSATSNSVLFTIGASATNQLRIYENSGAVSLGIGADSVSGFRVVPGEWYFIAAVINSSTTESGSGSYLYVNGVSAGLSAVMNSFPSGINDDARLVIGQDLDLASSGLTGSVGLTRVFNRNLSEAEIMMNYLSTIPSMSRKHSLKIG